MTMELSTTTLRRLVTDGLVEMLGGAPGAEAVLAPGCAWVLSNEPVVDLNCLVVGPAAEVDGRFETGVRACLDRGLPFLAMVFPDAAPEIGPLAVRLGLTRASNFPLMVREDHPLVVSGAADVSVAAADEDAADDWARVLAEAFGMPTSSAARAWPREWIHRDGLDLFLARRGDRCVGAVTLTYHGEIGGLWGMGTLPAEQGTGVGRRLLTEVIARARARGARRLVLGATSAGYPLYRRTGFETRCITRGWVGEAPGAA